MTAQSLKTPKSCFRIQCCLLAFMMCASSGCTVIKYGTQTLITEPARFAVNVDRHRTEKENKVLAQSAWERWTACNPGSFSEDYHQGFVTGFAENLEYGGNVAPPLVPPRQYWKRQYRSPEGRGAIQDWFAGHTAGFEYAHDMIPRQITSVASSLAGPSVRFDRMNTTASEPPQSAITSPGEMESIPESNPQLPETDQRPAHPDAVLPEQEQAPQSSNLPLVPSEAFANRTADNIDNAPVTAETAASQPIRGSTEQTENGSTAETPRQQLPIPDSFEIPVAPAESFQIPEVASDHFSGPSETDAGQEITPVATMHIGDRPEEKTYATIRETTKPAASSGRTWESAANPFATSNQRLPSSTEYARPTSVDESGISPAGSFASNLPDSFAMSPIPETTAEATGQPREIQSHYIEDSDSPARISLRSYDATLPSGDGPRANSAPQLRSHGPGESSLGALPTNLQHLVHQQGEHLSANNNWPDAVIQIPGSEEIVSLPPVTDDPAEEKTLLPSQETVDLPSADANDADLLPNFYFPTDSAAKP